MNTNFLNMIDGWVWGIPTIILILGVGILLSVRLGFLQFRHLGKALKYMWRNEDSGEGEVSSFGALCTALAATIGTGNIVGVATAVVAGGPGALFWLIVAGAFGMATKYSEGLLAIVFREYDPKTGHALGGPFMYIEKGMGEKWKWLAKCFAVFGALAGVMGIGTMVQVNGIAGAANTAFDPNNEHMISFLGGQHSIAVVIVTIVVTAASAAVILGGIKRIASVTSFIVPFMAVVYVTSCLAVLLYNIKEIPSAVVLIVESAFGAKAVAGGALGAMMIAMQKGVARGIFSNEAGLGSAPIAVAAAKTNEPARQGLITMTQTFIDTIVICTMTGLTIVVTGAYKPALALNGVDVTIYAFNNGLPWGHNIGAYVLLFSLSIFAFTTILGWNYYGEKCMEYLTRSEKSTLVYRVVYVSTVFIGPFLSLETVWTVADIFNGLMAIPNLIALLALNGVVVKYTKDYFKRLNTGKIKEF